MKRILVATLLVMSAVLAGCAVPEPEKTPLEIQTIQTRQYTAPTSVVFASAISVFQNLGYTITNADKGTGFISAESAAKNNVAFQLFTGSTLGKQTRATAFVEKIKNKTNIRMSFVEVQKSSSAWGQQSRNDTPILDLSVYQNAFEKLENEIFLRTSS